MDLNIKNWNMNQFKAAGKHVVSFAAGATGVAVAFHFLTPTDASAITNNVSTIYDGLMKVGEGVAGLFAVLAPIYTAFRAANNASPVIQAQSLEKAVPGTTVVTSPKIAAALPDNPNVVSNTEVKVVNK